MSLEDRTRKAGRTEILSEVVPVEPDHMQVTTNGIEGSGESSTNAEADGKVNLMGLMGALRPFLEKIARDRWGSESSDITVAGSGDGIDASRARVDCLQGNIQAMNDYRNHINNISDGLFEAIRPLYGKLDSNGACLKAQVRTAFILEVMAHMINQKHSAFSTHMLHRLYLSGVSYDELAHLALMGLVSYPCKENLMNKMRAEVANSRLALDKMLGCEFTHFEFLIDDFFWQRKRATPNKKNTFSDAQDVTTSCVKMINMGKVLSAASDRSIGVTLDPYLNMGCGRDAAWAICAHRNRCYIFGSESRRMNPVLLILPGCCHANHYVIDQFIHHMMSGGCSNCNYGTTGWIMHTHRRGTVLVRMQVQVN